ncbi:hypothetical protein M413DRAFT_248465 [Hebeloma cylindrosporum]|uniref:Xylanolytic transcriptional activator regulatory domain-containing protein n=1 Tax=Hebeloma cylindrosporum TaxID=76867 RepID=A0A0C3BNK6_HEBCY|nr:hypothetical protein M413DRAFT_248465 [Hebeloma cylindrosporum h7]
MGSGGKEKEPKQKKKPGRVRLKLRCDRNVPCEKCVSRGCGSICPDGVLAPGRGNRLILANTEQLHERIDHISARNRELENALRTLQQAVSDQPHPLLSMDVLRINTTAQHGSSSGPSTSSSSKSPSASRISPTTHPPNPTEVKQDDEQNVIDAFGTLIIARRGESGFLGRTARSDLLVQATNGTKKSPSSLPRISKRMLEASFPDPGVHDEALVKQVLNLLPSQAEAQHLCEVYLEYGKFLYSPIPKKELLDETLAVVYRAKNFGAFEHHHSLSLLFIIFAIATLFNPNQQPYPNEAREYYKLSRTALNFTQPVQETTVAAVQTLIHMAQYLELGDPDDGGPEAAWIDIGHAMRLGLGMGLHLNSSRWKLQEEIVQRRCDLFWRLFLADTWMSFHLGRPSTISRTHIDCPPPRNLDRRDGDLASNFHTWNIHYTILLHDVMDTALTGARLPKYSDILDLDRKIRDFDVPLPWRMPMEDEEPSPPPPEVSMYRWLVLSAKEIALLNLHRGYFAQALQEMPADLHRHRYLPSVVAIYRSAWRLIHGLAMTWIVIPKFLARVNLAWSHGLSAAVVMCLLVTRAPTTHLTASATEELDNITSLFDSSASSCRSTAKLLSSVQNLRRKAHEVLGLPHHRFHHSHHHDENPTITLTELDRLNGKTHLLVNEAGYTSSSNPSMSTSAGGGALDPRSRATSVTISDITDGHPPPPPPAAPFHLVLSEEMHPTLAQDVRDFSVRSNNNSSHYTSTSSTMGSASGSRSSAPPSIARAMSFYDYPSEHAMDLDAQTTPLALPPHRSSSSRTSPPPPPPPPPAQTTPTMTTTTHRETPDREYLPAPHRHRASFHRHSSGPNPRIEPPPQMQYFQSSVQPDSLDFLSVGGSGAGGGAGAGGSGGEYRSPSQTGDG